MEDWKVGAMMRYQGLFQDRYTIDGWVLMEAPKDSWPWPIRIRHECGEDAKRLGSYLDASKGQCRRCDTPVPEEILKVHRMLYLEEYTDP